MMKNQKLFEMIFLPFSLLCLLACGLYFRSDWIVTLCTMLGMTGSVLNGSGKKYCYFFLLVSSLMYAYVSFTTKYYGEAILHLCFVSPLFLYSIIRWFVPRKKEKSAGIFCLTLKKGMILLAILLVLVAGYGWVLLKIGSKLPLLNAASTAAALAANYLSAKRMKEQWYAQLFSNAAMITLWLLASVEAQGSFPMMVQNILFVASNIRGAIVWNKQEKEDRRAAEVCQA